MEGLSGLGGKSVSGTLNQVHIRAGNSFECAKGTTYSNPTALERNRFYYMLYTADLRKSDIVPLWTTEVLTGKRCATFASLFFNFFAVALHFDIVRVARARRMKWTILARDRVERHFWRPLKRSNDLRCYS